MTDREQTKAFDDELAKLIERFRAEYDMTYASVVGVLHIRAHLLCQEAQIDEEGRSTDREDWG